ncbi:MAG: Clp1/GlmU family protein [Anaerolineae bacterium]
MIDRDDIEVPESWQALDIAAWRGPILVVGASNTGKSTFARYLYRRLLETHTYVAFLDADMGQNSYRLPTTMVVARNESSGEVAFPPCAERHLWFVGGNAPPGHMLRVILGLSRLVQATRAETLIIDTTGFVDARFGGTHLKWAQVELLRPCTVVVFQRERELRSLLLPLHPLPGVRVIELSVPAGVRLRSREERRAYRAACYREYFAEARRVSLNYHGLAVFPARRFLPGRLAALEDREGFALALGFVEGADERVVHLRAPLLPGREETVAVLRLGDLRLDTETFQDCYL